MSSRDKILSAINKSKPAFIKFTNVDFSSVDNEDELLDSFISVLDSIHAKVKKVFSFNEVDSDIKELKANNCFVLNAMEEIENDREDLELKNKEQIETLDYAFIKGEIGVAENGAIWITDKNCKNRLLPFICKQLCLVIKRKCIVANMHEAYQVIKMEEIGFGVFISGPSKTADIEQSLVIGAHGALGLTVYIID